MAGSSELTAEQRRRKNASFAERILDRWCESGPASGHRLFRAILQKAVEGPIATPERARAILPTLLEVLDEMEEIETALTSAVESGDQSGYETLNFGAASGIRTHDLLIHNQAF